MGNWLSNPYPKDLSSPQHSGSSSAPQRSIPGDYSGNTGNNNTYGSGNTTINNYGSTGSSESHAKILQCLYISSYDEHRRRVREPVEGTCTWVMEHPKYKDWLEKKSPSLLWLSADPGYGKSVIASFLIEQLQRRPGTMVCYFFFKDDSDEQRSAAFALCAILHQIFKKRKRLIEFAKEDFDAKGSKFTQEVGTLWDILIKAIAAGECGDVICVVDALDECEKGTLSEIIRHVTSLPGSQTSDIPLKFLVTSRPYRKIERELGSPATTIRLKGEDEVNAITSDVTRVIDEGIKNLESHWGSPAGLGYLRNLLKSSADRTFLWVSLVLDILKESDDCSREEFTSIVSTAPPDLAGVYTKILDRSTHPEKARRILNIVVAAVRPLTIQEMNVAYRANPHHKSVKDLEVFSPEFERTVKNLCGLFVRIIDSKIYLVHQTAREFLLGGSSSEQGIWQHSLCHKNSNVIMAEICISYLALEEFEGDPGPLDIFGNYREGGKSHYSQEYSFLNYAARHWTDHVRDSQDRQRELFEFARPICEAGSNRLLTWFQVHWFSSGRRGKCPKDFTHLMVASWLGLGTVVERLLGEGGDINARCREYGTALNIAALRKDKGVTGILLQKNVNAYLGGKELNILHTNRSELEPKLRPEWWQEKLEWEREKRKDKRKELERRQIEPFCIQDTPDISTRPNQGTTSSP